MVADQVLAAQGEERTEEPWTWVTGVAPPGPQAHNSKPPLRSDQLTSEHSQVLSNGNFSFSSDP